jgi:hypothetical protein
MCGGCGDIAHESDVRWCVSCDQCVCFDFDVGAACMSRGGMGLDGDFDACNAHIDQHFARCGACGDVTHSADLIWADNVGCMACGEGSA